MREMSSWTGLSSEWQWHSTAKLSTAGAALHVNLY